MKTLLICHEDSELNRQGITRWLASFSDLVGIVVLRERKQRVWRRIRREAERVGVVRLLDVAAFRVFYRLFLARRDGRWLHKRLEELYSRYPEVPEGVPVLRTHSPNTYEAERFIREHSPDIMVARCKTLLQERIFTIPSRGTFAMHPGICPEYRNAHGCFWALANDDLGKVGTSLIQLDRGVDRGPVYGYYCYDYDEVRESHVVIQHRAVLENLDQLRQKLTDIYHGCALPLDTAGRPSATWGQPWLTAYLGWKRRARRRVRQ